jgi:3-dehydroquinate dehydratase I
MRRTLPAAYGRVAASLGHVCTTVSAPTEEEMVAKAEIAFSLGSDIVEFRIDLMEGVPSGPLRRLAGYARRSIITVRRREQGGRFSGEERERLGLIKSLCKLRPAYVDIEATTAVENEEWFSSLPRTPKKIISWHDFSGTPSVSVLRTALSRATALGDVSKIVTTAINLEDNLKVLSLYGRRRGDLIAFCMGPEGSASRLVSMQIGSPVTYASLPGEPVAPGQLSVTTLVGLKRLWERTR